MQVDKEMEAQMRYKLLGRRATRIEHQPGLQVILRVREPWGGVAKDFAVQTSTISRLEAELLAKREARRQGKTPQFVFDIGNNIFDADVKPYIVKA